MAWTCYYCTYEQDGASSLCELCGMPGNTSSTKSKSTATMTATTMTATRTRTTTNTDNTSSQNTTTQRRHRTGGTQRGVGRERAPAAATVIDLTAPQPPLGTRAGECLSRKRKVVPSKSSTTSITSSSSSRRRLGRSTEAHTDTDARASTGAEFKSTKTTPRPDTREKAAAPPTQTQATLSFATPKDTVIPPAAAAAASFSHGHTFAYTRRTSTEYDAEQMQHVLHEVFHLSRLRNLQPQAIRGAMEHQSQMIVMATGYVVPCRRRRRLLRCCVVVPVSVLAKYSCNFCCLSSLLFYITGLCFAYFLCAFLPTGVENPCAINYRPVYWEVSPSSFHRSWP